MEQIGKHECRGGRGAQPPSQLPYDVLGIVFSFVPLAYMPVVMRVCHHWYRAASKGKARLENLLMHKSTLDQLCVSTSPLRRHIASLQLFGFDRSNRHLEPYHTQSMHMLPNLTNVTLHAPLGEWMQHVPHLTSIVLPIDEPNVETAIIRHLSQLITLRLNRVFFWRREQLTELICAPCSLQLQEIDLRGTVLLEDTIRILTHFPSLTTLEPRGIVPRAYPFLSHFPCLQRIRLTVLEFKFLKDYDIESYFTPCTAPTHLTLAFDHNTFNDQLVQRVLCSISKLRSLRMESCDALSLDFLQPIARKLESLHLTKCNQLLATDVLQLEQLSPNLTTLHISMCNTIYFNVNQLHILKRPSLFMPKLQTLYYETRLINGEERKCWLRAEKTLNE